MSNMSLGWGTKLTRCISLDRLEKIAKITGLVFLPIAIAFHGCRVQEQELEIQGRRDMFKTGIEILQSETAEPELRQWAIGLVNSNSRVHLPDLLSERLKSGEMTIPLLAPLRPMYDWDILDYGRLVGALSSSELAAYRIVVPLEHLDELRKVVRGWGETRGISMVGGREATEADNKTYSPNGPDLIGIPPVPETP